MVLQLGDLPDGFGLDSGHYVSNADLVKSSSTRKDYRKLGRLTGHEHLELGECAGSHGDRARGG